MNNRVILTSY